MNHKNKSIEPAVQKMFTYWLGEHYTITVGNLKVY